MMLRWAIATAGALALALLTLNVPMPWASALHESSGTDEASAVGGAVCDAKSKPANLNFTLKDAATIETLSVLCFMSHRTGGPKWTVDGLKISRGVAAPGPKTN